MIRLAIRCRPEQAELVLADLAAVAPNGVEERLIRATDGGGAPGSGGPGAELVEYSIYGAPGELPEMGELDAAVGSDLVEVEATEVPDDWADRWREFHRPVTVGGRVSIRPPWAEPPRDPGLLDLVIDPGRAFGTGAHATTRLCLELMVELADQGCARRGDGLVDLGAGSGVLAIAAVMLGLSPVHAYDNDPASVEAVGANAAANGIELSGELLDLRRQEPPTAPITVANLTAPMLAELAGRLSPGRLPWTLICSGILTEQVDTVAQAFSTAGLAVANRRTLESWVALRLVAA